jgi:two-component system KDP operon response regulator KdpE
VPLVAILTPDESVRDRLRDVLSQAEFEVVEAADALDAVRLLFAARPQVCIVNARASGLGQVDVISLLSGATDIPILALVSESDPVEVASLLDAGASDVVTLEIGSAELVARVRTLMRSRSYLRVVADENTVRTGEIVIDRAVHAVFKRGQRIALTPTEYWLLDALASRLGEVVPYHELLSAVWGDDREAAHRLRIYAGYLRSKLEDDPSRPLYIVREAGAGYRLAALPDPNAEGEG